MKNSYLSKTFNKIRNKLLNIPGQKEAAFIKLGFKYTNKKEGSLDGKTSHDVLKSDHLMKIVAGQDIFKFVETGDSTILSIAEEYQKMRQKEFNLTCPKRSFSHHEINDVEFFFGLASRLESILYPDQIMLMSLHYRAHLAEILIANRELIARDSTTEFLNQRALRRERATKYARSFPEKANQINQRLQTEATALDFRNLRSCQRAETSGVLPAPEKVDG